MFFFIETRYVNASSYVFFFETRHVFIETRYVNVSYVFFRIASYVFFCMSKRVAFFFFKSERVVFFILLGFGQYFLFLDSSWYLGIPSTYFNFTRKISVCTNVST